MDTQIKEIFNCTSTNNFFQQLPPKSHLCISCLHINIRSSIKNFTKLLQIIHNCNFPLDVIVITEAGITNNIVNLFNIPGYNMYSQLRSNRKGGGIIIYVRNHLKFTLTPRKTITFESLTGTLKLNSNQDVVVCAVYRPPSSNKSIFVKELGAKESTCISKFDLKQNLLLIGDTNIDLKSISSCKDTYLEALSEYGLMCGITDFTRIESKLNNKTNNYLITKTCIDHIFARFPTSHPYSAVLDVVLADHRAVIFACIDDAVPKRIQGVTKQIINYDILYKELKKVRWCDTNSMNVPSDIFQFIQNSFHNANKLATCTKTYNNTKNKWAITNSEYLGSMVM